MYKRQEALLRVNATGADVSAWKSAVEQCIGAREYDAAVFLLGGRHLYLPALPVPTMLAPLLQLLAYAHSWAPNRQATLELSRS